MKLLQTVYFHQFGKPFICIHFKSLTNKNLIFITTCRNSYVDRIWDRKTTKELHYLYGFDDYETINEAVKKYFTKYKIKADLPFASLENSETQYF